MLLVDESKLSARGRQAIVPLSQVTQVLADNLTPEEIEQLRVAGLANSRRREPPDRGLAVQLADRY